MKRKGKSRAGERKWGAGKGGSRRAGGRGKEAKLEQNFIIIIMEKTEAGLRGLCIREIDVKSQNLWLYDLETKPVV